MSSIKKLNKEENYKRFDCLNGDHPLKEVVPNGFVDYEARTRRGGKVVYFNFDLAREMGLISKNHDDFLTEELKEKILETFSIQIINEFDLMNQTKISDKDRRPGMYMATRYLQLQHGSKKGKTSGDGRSIWNGQVNYGGKSWDVSSCGTGGTCLSPATSKFNKFFETGDPSISYGCGYAEIDEGFTTAVFSQIFHQAHRSTERSLAIIEFKNKISINIRAHECLIRPSHVFLYLKQDDLDGLTALIDYYIENQRQKAEWASCPQGKQKYDFFLDHFSKTFSHLAADFEDEYIFCWLDWDGDNILMDGGIIDYGSIRQFGLCHSEYRYDDVDRFSTNLYEQKGKAKYIVKNMIQAIEYIKNGTKINLQEYVDHNVLTQFESEFENKKNNNLLIKIGFSERKIKQILKRDLNLVKRFRKVFSYVENLKTHRGEVRISDGVTIDAIFSMRKFLREFPQIYLHREENLLVDEILDLLITSLADEVDCELSTYRKQKLLELQTLYIKVVEKVSHIFQEPMEDSLLALSKRALVINKEGRATGDAITYIVDLLLKNKRKMSHEDLASLICAIGETQNFDPDQKKKLGQKMPKGLLSEVLDIFIAHREGI